MEIPADWKALFESIRAPQVLLAGGAMRDLYCNVTPKDLDFFVHVDEEMPFEGPWRKLVSHGNEGFDYEGMQYVQCVRAYEGFDLPINVIFCDRWTDTETFLKSFDFGIN